MLGKVSFLQHCPFQRPMHSPTQRRTRWTEGATKSNKEETTLFSELIHKKFYQPNSRG